MTPVPADIVFQVEIFHVAVFHVAVLFFWTELLMIVSSILLPLHIVIWDSVSFSTETVSVELVHEWSKTTTNIRDNILRREYIGI